MASAAVNGLSVNPNVCIRYGFTSSPKPLKMQLKMHQHYRNNNVAKYCDIDSD